MVSLATSNHVTNNNGLSCATYTTYVGANKTFLNGVFYPE